MDYSFHLLYKAEFPSLREATVGYITGGDRGGGGLPHRRRGAAAKRGGSLPIRRLDFGLFGAWEGGAL